MNSYTRKINAYLIELFISLLIFFTPFLIHLHLFGDDSLDQLQVLSFSITHGFASNQVYLWFLLSKLIPVLLLSIWYTTTIHRWRVFILIPHMLFFNDLVQYHLDTDLFSIKYVSILILLSLFAYVALEKLNGIYLLRLGNRTFRWKFTSLIEYNFPRKFYDRLNLIIPNDHDSQHKYLQSLYHASRILNKKGYRNQNAVIIPDLTIGKKILIFSVLVITPLIYYSYLWVEPGASHWNFAFIRISSFGFTDVQIFLWTIAPKISLIVTLILWFLFSKGWWKYAIISPISITIIQVQELFGSEIHLDKYNTYLQLPFLLGLLAFLVFVSTQIRYRYKLIEVYEFVHTEIEKLISIQGKTHTVIFQETLDKLKKSGTEADPNPGLRLQRLLELKEEIQRQINKKD